MKDLGLLKIRHLIDLSCSCPNDGGARLDQIYRWKVEHANLVTKTAASLAAALFAAALFAVLRGDFSSDPFRGVIAFVGAALVGLYAGHNAARLKEVVSEYVEAFVLLDLINSVPREKAEGARQRELG